MLKVPLFVRFDPIWRLAVAPVAVNVAPLLISKFCCRSPPSQNTCPAKLAFDPGVTPSPPVTESLPMPQPRGWKNGVMPK